MDTSKIIKGVINSGRYTVTAPIMQEHYGIILKIEGAELPETYQVDFSNDEHHGTSVTMIGNADGVLIPRQFIDTGKDVFAFLYWVGEDYGKTVYKFRIPNKVRPDRTSEQPTPEEQSVIDQAISALNTAVEQTAQDAIDADQSAQSAQGYAEQAETARDTAQTYAEQAEASATSASQSATASANSASASAQSASQSAQIKSDVEDMVDDAQGYAQASVQSASQASASEQGCARAVLDAASAAAIARARADEANGYAQTASSKALEASTSAQTASNKASEAAQSASQTSGYAQTAETAKMDAQTAQGLAESARDTAVQAKTDAESARDEAQNLVDGISGKVEQIDENTERIESLEDDRYKPYVVDSASGAIASFPDGADGIPLKSLVVDINPVQSGTGDPSPDNVRPISGWEGMQLSVNGTVVPISWQSEAGTVYGGKLDVLSGVMRVEVGVLDMSTTSWILNVGTHRATTTAIKNLIKIPSSQFVKSGSIAENYTETRANVNITVGQFAVLQGGTVVLYYDGVNAPSGKLVYPLATPITIQLTPHEVNSLLGVNNIFADTGDSHVEYRADTRLYIEKLTQPEEDDMIADSAISEGQFFMIGNSLYRALANIASGATITVGTNAQRVSLADALNLVNA